jgi:hypothetical protein
MITNGEDGSCERNMRPHNKDNELSCELTTFNLGDVSDCEPIFNFAFISDYRPGWDGWSRLGYPRLS